MAMSTFLRTLRARVGNSLLVLPAVSVLPRDGERLLMVRLLDTGTWSVIGGTVEPDEDPAAAAVREAREEAGVELALGAIITAVGGRRFRVVYPNGDVTSYVTIVYDAVVTAGQAAADGDETAEARWFDVSELIGVELTPFTRALFDVLGPPLVHRDPSDPAAADERVRDAR